ncbi:MULTISPECIES: AbiV family abortive infection protein [Methylobacter]
MKSKAIKNLAQLNDTDLFQQVAIGLEKIYEHCIELNKTSELLAKNKDYRAFNIIEAVKNEEAAKYLILIDVLRCPRKIDKPYFTRQLSKFNDHLAKIIYSELCSWKPSYYEELCGYISRDINKFYLDEYTDENYFFRNRLINERENFFYVDYTEHRGERRWIYPENNVPATLFCDDEYTNPSAVMQMVKSLHRIGISKYESIKIFSEFWREFKFSNETLYGVFYEANQECFKHIYEKNLFNEDVTQSDYDLIISEFPFPLYKEEITLINIDKGKLIEQKEIMKYSY